MAVLTQEKMGVFHLYLRLGEAAQVGHSLLSVSERARAHMKLESSNVAQIFILINSAAGMFLRSKNTFLVIMLTAVVTSQIYGRKFASPRVQSSYICIPPGVFPHSPSNRKLPPL